VSLLGKKPDFTLICLDRNLTDVRLDLSARLGISPLVRVFSKLSTALMAAHFKSGQVLAHVVLWCGGGGLYPRQLLDFGLRSRKACRQGMGGFEEPARNCLYHVRDLGLQLRSAGAVVHRLRLRLAQFTPEQARHQKLRTGARQSRTAGGLGTILLILLVGGTGIEPVTPTV
jgi:hypothetical protein